MGRRRRCLERLHRALITNSAIYARSAQVSRPRRNATVALNAAGDASVVRVRGQETRAQRGRVRGQGCFTDWLSNTWDAVAGWVRQRLDQIQLALDLAGLTPGIGNAADFLNGVISLLRGRWGEAGLNFAAMLPGLGQGVTLGKLGAKGAALAGVVGGIGKFGDEAAEIVTGYGRYVRRVDNYKHALDPNHVRAAAKEKAGEILKRKPDGAPFDHLGETRRAMAGAKDHIINLKKHLSDPNLSQADRAVIEEELRLLSRMLDQAEGILGELAR